MVKPKTVIGITTYKSILDPAFGEALFTAYERVSSRLLPFQVAVQLTTYSVTSRESFAAHWCASVPFELRDRRGGEIIQRGDHRTGAEWRTKGALSGRGSVAFAPELDPHRPNEITLTHNYSATIDWPALFRALVELFEPAYAMLHVFTDRAEDATERHRFAFDGPIVGEAHFTSWLDSAGEWRRPDGFRIEERRRYRFLTDLAWANLFGPEFTGRLDVAALAGEAEAIEVIDRSIYVQVTERIGDVVNDREGFCRARVRVKTAFAPDFFRN